IIRTSPGFHIVEEKDASEFERRITEVNSGLYILRTTHIKQVLSSIKNENKSGEFYLTDMFQDQFKVKPLKFSSEVPFLGINTLTQLSHVNDLLRVSKLRRLMDEGVMVLNPSSVYLEESVEVGPGTVIYPGVTL